jgi:hypothetical protein
MGARDCSARSLISADVARQQSSQQQAASQTRRRAAKGPTDVSAAGRQVQALLIPVLAQNFRDALAKDSAKVAPRGLEQVLRRLSPEQYAALALRVILNQPPTLTPAPLSHSGHSWKQRLVPVTRSSAGPWGVDLDQDALGASGVIPYPSRSAAASSARPSASRASAVTRALFKVHG